MARSKTKRPGSQNNDEPNRLECSWTLSSGSQTIGGARGTRTRQRRTRTSAPTTCDPTWLVYFILGLILTLWLLGY